LIGWPRQPAPVARRVCLARECHAGGYDPFEPADPIAQVGDLLAHPRQVDGSVAHPLVEQNDLAQRLDRIATEAHAVAVFPRRRVVPLRFAGPAKVSETLR